MCAVASEYLSLWIPNFHWKFWFPALLTYASSGLVWTSGYMGILPSDNQSRREVPVPFAPPAAFSIISSDCFDISNSFWIPPWRHHPGRHNVSRQTSTQLSRKMLTGPCLGENCSVLKSLNTFDSLYAEIPLVRAVGIHSMRVLGCPERAMRGCSLPERVVASCQNDSCDCLMGFGCWPQDCRMPRGASLVIGSSGTEGSSRWLWFKPSHQHQQGWLTYIVVQLATE